MSEIRVDTISEKTSANGVAIDGVTLKDGGIAATLASTITTADNTDTLTLISTDADANSGPILRLNRDSGSPADGDVIGEIHFNADDDAGNTTSFFSMSANIRDASNGDEDVQMVFSGFRGGNNVNYLEFDGDHVVFNEGSADIDFRVESNGDANCFFVNGGNNFVGIGTSTPGTSAGLDKILEIQGADPGLVLRDNTASDVIEMYNSSGNTVFFNGGADGLILKADGKNSTKGETAPDVSAGGLCIQQGANDTTILSFKSSDIAHGVTDSAETDTWCKFTKESAANGGLIIQSYTEAAGSEAFKVIGTVGGTNFNTGKATSGHAVIEFAAAGSDGSTGDADVGSNGNLFCIQNRNTARFFFDAEGDFHADSSSTTFDEYDDAQLARTFDITHGRGVIKSKFDKFISYNHEKLAELQLVGREENGTPNHFINVTGMQRLHNGAIWQQYEKHQRLAEAVYEMAKETLGEDKADAILKKHDIKLLN